MKPAVVSLILSAGASILACSGPVPKTVPEPAAQAAAWPERAVRRDLPMTPAIRKAYARGTRDSSGAPGRSYFQQKVDYRIDASLTPADNEVRGRETITLHNTTPDTLKTVVLRLYQNYFTPRVERNDYITDVTDGVTIENLSINGSAIPLTNNKQYSLRERIATITPASPILPGATATIETAWRFVMPNVDTTVRGQRMGRYGNYLYQVAQWYPQIAMYDELRGWDTDQYLGSAEFNNQFGSFDVRITAPGGWLLGATGKLENPEQVYSKRTLERLAMAMQVDTTIHVVDADERGAGATASGSTLTWHFTAPLVNDFAFAVSRDYAFDATHATIPGKGKIPVSVLYLPQHINYRKNNTAQYGRKALEAHSRTLFPYEFSQGTIADGPETGMEYPMIIFNGSSLGVTVHEFGHQWFPMMVGSNETRYGFMDEGFNDYIDEAAEAAINRSELKRYGVAPGYQRIAGTELEAPLMWPADYAGPGYGVQTYTKPPIALNALGAVVGDSAVGRGLAEYAKSWKYKHPTPYDFFFSMNKSLGKNLDWFWYEWFFTTYTTDQSIESVTTAGADAVITVRDKGDLVSPVIAAIEFTDGSKGRVVLPAERWFSGSRTLTERMPLSGRTIKSITLDPEGRFQDLDRSNNVWPRP
ncbi:MAG TPA: M1 family metallopeptidase [Gemmatimonadaceae bacterium]|nr:M1 family metallopeptidase [Gemmatimonadaceae bacterium]